jgi:hypothetical protein
MPITYERDDLRRRITVTVKGDCDVDEIVATVDRQASESTWHYSRLYDTRGLHAAPTTAQIKALLGHVRERTRVQGPRGPVAVVTDHHAVYGMVRMYMSLGENDGTVEVFRDIAEAERWLKARAAAADNPGDHGGPK